MGAKQRTTRRGEHIPHGPETALLVAPGPRGHRPARRDMGCGLSRVKPGLIPPVPTTAAKYIPPVPTTAAKYNALERDVPSAGKASENNKLPSSKGIETTVAPELLGYPVPTAKVAPGGDGIIADSPVPPLPAAESFAEAFPSMNAEAFPSMKKAQSFRNRRLSIDAAAMSDATEAHRFAMRAPASDALLDEY